MTGEKLIQELNIDVSKLQPKKEQTTYKIKYIKSYVEKWLQVQLKRKEIKYINFIDCMCNSGIYEDGDLCTSIEVLKIFRNVAYQHQDKIFNLFLNDIKKDRIEIIKKLCDHFVENYSNISYRTQNKDVNEYLDYLTSSRKTKRYDAATILYVDPYDFGTVHIEKVKNFITTFYSELIFNIFTSDFVRNHMDARIRKCIGSDIQINNKEELLEYIANEFKTKNIQYSFSYGFYITTNTELYQIFYATPSLKGLELLKDSLWEIFGGRAYYRNMQEKENQTCMFTQEDEEKMRIDNHAVYCQRQLLNKFCNCELSYYEIEKYLLEHTLLNSTKIIGPVLRPLIDKGCIKKLNNNVRINNYTKDSYFIRGFNE